MAWIWVQYVFESSSATGSRRLLLAALAERADEQGGCWPGVHDLAKRATLHERQVRRLLAELEHAGELRILAGGHGRRSPNAYVIIGGRKPDQVEAAVKNTLARMGKLRMSPVTEQGCHPCHPNQN